MDQEATGAESCGASWRGLRRRQRGGGRAGRRARRCLAAALVAALAVGAGGDLLAELAMLDLKAGRTDDAEMQAGQCLILAEEIGDRAGRVLGVGLCAALAALRGQRWPLWSHATGHRKPV